MSVEIPILADAVMIFGLSCAVIVASHKLRIPTIIGFLLTGVLAGPHFLGLVGASHEVEMFAEVGVILLLFVIGLELSLDELIRLKRPVFVGGAAQVLLTIAVMGLPLVFLIRGLANPCSSDSWPPCPVRPLCSRCWEKRRNWPRLMGASPWERSFFRMWPWCR